MRAKVDSRAHTPVERWGNADRLLAALGVELHGLLAALLAHISTRVVVLGNELNVGGAIARPAARVLAVDDDNRSRNWINLDVVAAVLHGVGGRNATG